MLLQQNAAVTAHPEMRHVLDACTSSVVITGDVSHAQPEAVLSDLGRRFVVVFKQRAQVTQDTQAHSGNLFVG